MSLTLKKRLDRGDKLVGCLMLLPSPDVAEIVSLSGIDVAMIDHEHGTATAHDFVAQDRAIRGSRMGSIVRFPGEDLAYAQRLLDAGASGLVCPNVDSAEQAEAFVRACRYPPAGGRGAGTGIRGSLWGLQDNYYTTAAEDLLLVAQIESTTAVDNIEAICATPGIDMLLIGPRDLAGSLGALDRFQEPALWALVRRAEEAILASGKKLASAVHPGRTAQSMFADGYDLLLCGKDVDFLLKGAVSSVAAATGLSPQPPAKGTGLSV